VCLGAPLWSGQHEKQVRQGAPYANLDAPADDLRYRGFRAMPHGLYVTPAADRDISTGSFTG
jgi:hypothetical protein